MLVVGSLPRRPLQWKRLIKIELCFWLSVVRWSQVGHVVQNRQSALSLAWHEWFSCKGEEWKINCCGLASSSEPKIREFKKRPWQLPIWKFHVVVCLVSFAAVFRDVTQRFRGALRDIPKDGREGDDRLSDYVKKWHPKACRTYTTIRFHYLANEIVALPSLFPSWLPNVAQVYACEWNL